MSLDYDRLETLGGILGKDAPADIIVVDEQTKEKYAVEREQARIP